MGGDGLVRFRFGAVPDQLYGIYEVRLWSADREACGGAEHGAFGAEGDGEVFLLGTDVLGYDIFTRVLVATRISLSVPILAMIVSVLIGAIVGASSGYFGGKVDLVIQRIAEVLMSFPRVPLWMALAATLPPEITPYQRYVGIALMLAAVGWAGLSRQVRGKALAIRESDFVSAALVAGARSPAIIVGHILPNCATILIVSSTLMVPGLILAETSLSFLGIGIVPPLVSWGTLLKAAQSVQALVHAPWLLAPGAAIVIAVLSFNFVGDALRDALDPYSERRS